MRALAGLPARVRSVWFFPDRGMWPFFPSPPPPPSSLCMLMKTAVHGFVATEIRELQILCFRCYRNQLWMFDVALESSCESLLSTLRQANRRNRLPKKAFLDGLSASQQSVIGSVEVLYTRVAGNTFVYSIGQPECVNACLPSRE